MTHLPGPNRRRSWRLLACGLGLCAVLWSSAALAKRGVVKTRDGRTLEGEVIERPDQVLVNVKGIVTTLNRDNVASIETFDSIEQQLEAKRKAMPKNPTAND